MKPNFSNQIPSILSLTALTIAVSGLSAQAETTKLGVTTSALSPVPELKPTVTEITNISPNTPAKAVVEIPAYTIQLGASSLKNNKINLDNPEKLSESIQIPHIKLADSNLGSAQTIKLTPKISAETTVENTIFSPKISTSAADLGVQIAQTPVPPPQLQPTQPVTPPPTAKPQSTKGGRRFVGNGRAGDNYVGAGVQFSDPVRFAVVSKLKITEIDLQETPVSISFRPTVAFSDGVDLRFPVTIDLPQLNLETETPFDKLAPFFGLGAAISIDNNTDTQFNFMLTGGVDYVLSRDFTVTGALNLLFLDNVDAEFRLGVGYNF